jgi:hypothetical protein
MDTLPADLQLFEGRHTRPGAIPTIGIQRRGNLSLNASGFELLGEPAAVHLLYSPSTHIVAIKPVPKDTPQSYPVRKQQNARSWLIGARSFLNQYGVPFEEQEKVPAFTLTMVQGVGVAQLSEHPEMVPHDAAGQ